MRWLINPHQYRESSRQAAGSHRGDPGAAGSPLWSPQTGFLSLETSVPNVRDMHREGHRRISLQQRAKKGMNVYATTQLEFKEGFFFQVCQRNLSPPHQTSLMEKRHNHENNKHSHRLLNMHSLLGLGPSSFLA